MEFQFDNNISYFLSKRKVLKIKYFFQSLHISVRHKMVTLTQHWRSMPPFKSGMSFYICGIMHSISSIREEAARIWQFE